MKNQPQDTKNRALACIAPRERSKEFALFNNSKFE